MKELIRLEEQIIKCKRCPRLINFSKKIIKVKRKKNFHEEYWGKPVPGFGFINSKLMILGLAPAAHGGTRTGRAFTGDKSGDFLIKCLFKAGFANQSKSYSINDGLKLKNIYLTNILKCVPPNDKPEKKELENCSLYFEKEIKILKNIKIILTLGKLSFDNCIKYFNKKYNLKIKKNFKHGQLFKIADNKIIISSYHPSPRNVNRELINEKIMLKLLKKINKLI